MSILLNRLLVILIEEDLYSTNYHIAMVMLENFNQITSMTIGQLAKLCNVSKSTISKFIRKIGFDDYGEFRDSIPNHGHSQYSYNFNVMNYIESNSFDAYVDVINNDIRLLQATIQSINIDRLVKDIIRYKKVAAFGLLHSQTAAIDLQTKLAYNNKFIFTSMNDVKQNEYIANADEDTLIIIFSHSGNYMIKHQMVSGDIHKSAFDRTKAKIVVITSNHNLLGNTRADYYIEYPCSANISTHSVMYSMISDYIAMRYRSLINKSNEVSK